jgi:uncharacterized protein YbaP (TraB family)
MNRLQRLMTVAATAVGLSLAAAGSAAAEPALWAAHAPSGATVYLFGTVHALKKETAWRSPKLAAALKESQALWVEITDGDDQAKLQPLIMRLGVDAAHPLSTKVPAADLPRLDAAAKAMGAPGEAALEPMQPWLAALTLSVAPMIQAGYDPKSGVDNLLKAEATAAGKPVTGFETAEQQFHFLVDMSAADQVAFLESALDDAGAGAAKLNSLVAAWAAGDVPAIDRMENEEMIANQPKIYRLLIADRNARFADTLAERMKTPGVIFVAVGAAHLAGPDSLQRLLEQRGFTVERR